MSLDKYKYRLLFLEAQNRKLKKELRFYNRKLLDTQQSRQHWKHKYGQKRRVESSLNQTGDCLWGNQKAKHHIYSLLLVAFCANIQAYGKMSLRSCVHVLVCLQLALGTQRRLPCPNSIRSWVCKLGLYRIQSRKDSPQQWLYWVDESIHLGSEKILLVLGMAQQELDFTQPLSLSKLRVLHMQISEHWKGEQIGAVLQELNQHYPLSYIVSDEGHNLKKAYELTGFTHVPDVTHRLSKGIEKAYKEQPLFNEFCHWAGSLRKKWSLNSSRRDYLPPAQRSKVRFANLFPLVSYAQKHLQNWAQIPSEVQTELAFLQTHHVWIENFWQIQNKWAQISLILKTEGYSLENQERIKTILGEAFSSEAQIFTQTVLSYLQELSKKTDLPTRLYCCSDIIESAFGKLKQKLSTSSSAYLTEFIYTLAGMGSHYQSQEVKEALENIKDKDLRSTLRKTHQNESKTKVIQLVSV